MMLSIIIPAYNASALIGRALNSIFKKCEPHQRFSIEVIVINDGSEDAEALVEVCQSFGEVDVIHHDGNRGMCAARNTGIMASRGDFVTLLDADDEYLPEWYFALQEILREWPPEANVCFTPCVNTAGEWTCCQPGYRGWLTATDMVLERFPGEYNPIFRGDYIRQRLYTDLGIRKGCGTLSYLKMAREASFWITDKAQRVYHDMMEHSVSSNWTRPDKAEETHLCFSSVLAEHGEFILSVSPEKYLLLNYKLLIYQMLARHGRNFSRLWQLKSMRRIFFASLFLLLAGRLCSAHLLVLAKRLRILRRYG